MPQIDTEALINTLKHEIIALAENTMKDYATQAKQDGLNVVMKMESKLKIWTTQLAEGAINMDEFQFQLGTEEALLKMTALKQAGLAAIQVDKFRNGLTDIIIKTVSSLI